MKARLLFLFIFISAQIAVAQNAKDILDKVATTYKQSPGFILSFTINTNDIANKTTYSHDGTAHIKGNKFKIQVPDGITWFDGKTQWVYMTGGDEVNVSNPTGEELAAISPVALLNLYKSGFKLKNKGEKTENGKKVYLIEMIPEKKGSDVEKFDLKIDKASNLFTSISIYQKDKVNNQLIIKSTKEQSSIDDKVFTFNQNDYPDVEVIDLR
ncbi:hypothetical protein D0T53_07085 [Dysgonomonas sp. 216]|uniref:LolA-like putative outer membrane lipoprotein chaperone n=1 Tax=Dysgonomonas sp. 216 TaxID=2302934 RepID=UPI0013D81F3B|nr:LolA-like putative outer membrane lipoprotein chaperone [Dysgonomonas sp. 216]NDW18310.1 hypothetical protein [Dysgonomonas sp. 216]NDW18678.1 hypothetical protein [Dysgonomonas sp. 216]